MEKPESGTMVQDKDWIPNEVGCAEFEDKRLDKRFQLVSEIEKASFCL